ncbi:MAG: DNA/RNA nuclease SfsA [Candidatus Woesearchaeota archaeon]
MKIGPVYKGKLVRRYKRFLADITLDDGTQITAHCPNSGSMKTLSDAGNVCYVTYDPAPNRKLDYTLQFIDAEGLACVNTMLPNELVNEALVDGKLPFEFISISRERVFHDSRLDFFLDPWFVEVKNVTMLHGTVASFPDAVTARGKKHLISLQQAVKEGYKAGIFYVVNHTGALSFSIADWIDPEYDKEFKKAIAAGVQVFVYKSEIKIGEYAEISISSPLPFPS